MLVHLGILLSVVALAETPSDVPLSARSTVSLILVAVGSIQFCTMVCTAWAISTIALGSSSDRRRGERIAEFWERIFYIAWLGLILITFYGTPWVGIVRSAWQLDSWLLLDDLVLLIPVIAPLIGLWIGKYQVESSLASTNTTGSLGSYLGIHTRHLLGIPLVPAMLILAGRDWVMCSGIAPHAPAWFGLLGCLLILLILGAPWIVRYLWAATPLPGGRLRKRLDALLKRHAISRTPVLTWWTDLRCTNAAAVGIVPGFRFLAFSDRLLESLSEDEICAIALHEIGHLRRGHFWMRLVLLVAPLAWLGPFWGANFAMSGDAVGATIHTPLEMEGSWNPLVIAVVITAAAASGLVVMGGLSRILEFDADWWAMRASPSGDRKTALIHYRRSLAKIHQGGSGMERDRWFHPSGTRRVRLIEELSESHDAARRFERRMQQVRIGLVVFGLALPLVLTGLLLLFREA